MPEVYSLGQTPVTCHVFNANRSREYHHFFPFGCDELKGIDIELAVSLNSHEAQILNRQGNEWVSSVTLSEVSVFDEHSE